MPDFVDLFSNTQVQIIVALIAVDVVLGILGAVVRKEFRLGKVASFMKGSVLAYVFGYAVLELVAQGLPSLGFLGGALAVSFSYLVTSIVTLVVYRKLSGENYGDILVPTTEDFRFLREFLRQRFLGFRSYFSRKTLRVGTGVY